MNQFTLTPAILTNLTTIERLYGQLESLHLPQSLLLNLERDNLIQSSYVSNSIEGNPLSLPEVTNLLLDDRLPINRDEKEVKNYYQLLKLLPPCLHEPLTLDLILTLHRQLLTGVDDQIAGVFRDRRVVVGKHLLQGDQVQLQVKHEPPYHTRPQITTAMTQLLSWLNTTDTLPLIKIGLFHHQFVYLHPFTDGNGRTVRLLTAFLFLQHRYQINKYFVLDDYYDLDRSGYSDALHSADQGDSTQWLAYFTDGVRYSLQAAYSKAKNALSTIPKFSDRPTTREQEALALFIHPEVDLTTAMVADKLDVTRQQALSLLSNLVEKGLIEKHGSTKNSHYRIK